MKKITVEDIKTWTDAQFAETFERGEEVVEEHEEDVKMKEKEVEMLEAFIESDERGWGANWWED